MVAVVVLGAVMFNRVEQTFMDTVKIYTIQECVEFILAGSLEKYASVKFSIYETTHEFNLNKN